jgi:hypothetical protein
VDLAPIQSANINLPLLLYLEQNRPAVRQPKWETEGSACLWKARGWVLHVSCERGKRHSRFNRIAEENELKTSLCTGIGLIAVMLLCGGCQTAPTPTQAAPAAQAQPGQSGPPGQTGATGQPGEQGQTGDTGQPGDRGHSGDPGRPGDKGNAGDTGQKGDTGDRGKPAPCPDRQHPYTDPDNGRVRCVDN